MAKSGAVDQRGTVGAGASRKTANGRTAVARTAGSKSANGKPADGKAANGRAANGKAANGKAANGAAATAKNGRQLVDDPALARLEHALQAAAAGDFGVRLPARRKDDIGRLEAAYNQMAARNAALEAELVRVAEII